MTRLVLVLMLLLLAPGCKRESPGDRAAASQSRPAAKGLTEQLAETVREGAAGVSRQVADAQVLAEAERFLAAVSGRDLGQLKQFCTVDGEGEYGAILASYYQAFVLEDSRGPAAARDHLAAELARKDNSPLKDQALRGLNEYFAAKGSVTTREAAGIILVVALEAKYSHVGGRVGKSLAQQLGLLPPKTAATAPASGT
ncbi:MAG: hypothetical protein NTV86_02725 [Planctomycetota bacterium]|nr:hypothetical protein [Planctomycetota bacterium]